MKKQNDLFSYYHGKTKPLTKTVVCLDCDTKKLKMKLNTETGIYEGNRICEGCREKEKRRYIPNW